MKTHSTIVLIGFFLFVQKQMTQDWDSSATQDANLNIKPNKLKGLIFLMKKKTAMYNTLKCDIFGTLVTNENQQMPVIKVISDHLVINDECCDLRTIRERYNHETKEFTSSVIENILCAESFLTLHYAKAINGVNTLYDFITIDCSNSDDKMPETKQIKDLLCYDGLYIPLNKLIAVGYEPHSEAEIITLEDLKYVRYRTVMQSASENRQCKLTATTYPWDNFAKTISGNADYLTNPTQTAQKSIARQGLAKTNGNILNDFKFTLALIPDLETDITFNAKCYYDAENLVKSETISTKKVATDGCGFITPTKAREIADLLSLSYIPSAIQVRYGQVKGILLVFDFQAYSNGIVNEDILFTHSMWKADFDTDKAVFLVANVSKPKRKYAEWNYQMFCSLNNQLSFEDILPHVENIKDYMHKALNTPEDALQFLGILSDINALDDREEISTDSNAYGNNYECVDKVSAVINSNPKLAMNIKWVKNSIKKKIAIVAKKMLSGKIPMPDSSIAIMATDPLTFFNQLLIDSEGKYNFVVGKHVVPKNKQAQELSAHEFYYGGYEGELLSMRNPLTHWAQIRKLNCVEDNSSSRWYKHLNQVVIFNAFDETNLGMGGADFDGDICFITKLFADKFNQAKYIIYNDNNTGGKQKKTVLTEKLVQQSIRANLTPNMLGVICNINTRCQELLNDKDTLKKFVSLAGYMDDRSFDCSKLAQMPYYPKFKDMTIAIAYLQDLNHQLTTLSELEVDRPKTGYLNRFSVNQQEYTLPFLPYWFGNIKNSLEPFISQPYEIITENNFEQKLRILTKSYNDGKFVKKIHDTWISGTYSPYIRRTIEMMADTDSIMSNIQRYIQENIIDIKTDDSSCYSIVEMLNTSNLLDLIEVERINSAIEVVYKEYCRIISANIRALKEDSISQSDFDNALEEIIAASDDKLRSISDDRVVLAYSAYTLTSENCTSSGAFPFLTVLDGICILLDSVKTIDYFNIKLKHIIPDEASHVIVYNRQMRLLESVDPTKTYFGDVLLANGSYELHRNLKGSVSLIIPKPTPKDKINLIPFSKTTEFSVKVSYKASELAPEHQNGNYVFGLLNNSTVTFKESTMQGNLQYCIYAGDVWVGTVFSDKSNHWVLQKDIVKTLIGNEYKFICAPKTGIKVNSNSITTSTGSYRSAQILMFRQSAAVDIINIEVNS